ncbi:MAG: hypothetical protein LBE27_08420 [Deltaproteobacteria bacterium]|jgi:ribosomal protein L37AE/L43A|nr:hypothetical protein [Deltaproteobacteria bacterium]
MNVLKIIMAIAFWTIFGRLFGLLGIVIVTVVGFIIALIASSLSKDSDKTEGAEQNKLPSNAVVNRNNPNTFTIKCPKCDRELSIDRSNMDKIIKCLSCGLVFRPSELNNYVDLNKQQYIVRGRNN